MAPEKFRKPTDKELFDIALMFNAGVFDKERISTMVAMALFIVDRLYENGDVMEPTLDEIVGRLGDEE